MTQDQTHSSLLASVFATLAVAGVLCALYLPIVFR